MARLLWGSSSASMHGQGLDRGLVRIGEEFYSWEGLRSVVEDPLNGKIRPIYQNGVRIYNFFSFIEFSAKVEAFTYPDPIDDVLEGLLPNNLDISYRVSTSKNRYDLHLIYNCFLSYSDTLRNTITDQTNAELFTWDIRSIPNFDHDGVNTTSHLIIDSWLANPEALMIIEDILYGTSTTEPRIPTPFEIRYILSSKNPIEIVPNVTTGLSDLIDMKTHSDLIGNVHIGLYKKAPGSRLSNRDLLPGLNRLE